MTPLSEAEKELMAKTEEKLFPKAFDAYQGWTVQEVDEVKEVVLTAYRKGREESGYVIHEVHGEGGKTLDGQVLYWAKIRKLIGK